MDIFTAPSKYIQYIAEEDVSPIVHLPTFTESQRFHEITNNYNILFVGRLVNVKGVEFLIRAIPSVIKAFPQTRLTIVGDGFGKTWLINLAKKLQLEECIHFTGWVEHKKLDTYYEKSSVVVIPSIWPENYPISCMEAMSAGRPVIGTNVGGIPEIIDDGVNGYLVEPKSPEQIAEKVITLFSNEKLLKEMGRNARIKAEGFSIDKYSDNLEKVYEEAISKYKSR